MKTMKKQIFFIAITAMLFSSCVTLGKYEALESKNTQLRRDYNATQGELNDLREENAELQRQNQSLSSEIVDLNDNINKQTELNKNLQQEMVNMKMGYDTVIENYMQRITGQNQDLTRTNNMLAARTKELTDKENSFKIKEDAFKAKEAEFQSKEAEFLSKEAEFKSQEEQLRKRQAELEKKERATREALEAKERELENLRSSLNNALVGFADKGLNVETRDGKVYVSMESKLLFPSASWTVSKEGVEAIKTLAKVLESSSDFNILVEGHTDNAAYKGSTAVKDNWDLSVMRATAIVKLLLQYGTKIDPARIEACGHGEFAPKVPNDSPANKALNRRTEIILTPKMSNILNLLDN